MLHTTVRCLYKLVLDLIAQLSLSTYCSCSWFPSPSPHFFKPSCLSLAWLQPGAWPDLRHWHLNLPFFSLLFLFTVKLRMCKVVTFIPLKIQAHKPQFWDAWKSLTWSDCSYRSRIIRPSEVEVPNLKHMSCTTAWVDHCSSQNMVLTMLWSFVFKHMERQASLQNGWGGVYCRNVVKFTGLVWAWLSTPLLSFNCAQ